ncbi:hypothetical protein [Amycolatopsis solani]|uniref:hypothetical protein n=1 Tax=Amycolatopsis solani TaxID=3028615 RepID=UPI0025AF1AB4|nr:hypothetical protein [Amycolatopsis sp. MEP2-6]
MLTSLLPGLREVRTPIASGFAWLLVAWLAVADHLPKSRPPQHVFATLWDLGSYVGKGGLLVVVSFAAYLVGAFLEVDPLHLWEHGGRPRWINHLRDLARRGRFHHGGVFPLSDQTQRDLHDFTAEGYRFDSADHPRLYLPSGIMREERQLATKLQAANVELYNRYDRVLAEATFRINVTPPLVVLAVVVGWGSGAGAWLATAITAAAVVAGGLFFRQGVRCAIRSRDIIVQAVVAEVMPSRFLGSLAQAGEPA